MIVGLIFGIQQIPDNRFHIYFLDIGQGDSIFVKTPENHQILIDGGPKNRVLEEMNYVMPFFDRSIDMVVLTHPHADHVDGLVEVLKKYEVAAVLITGVIFKNPSYEEFLREIEKQNIKVFIAESGTDFKFGETIFDIIYPKKQLIGDKFENVNNSSVAMKIIYGDKEILLTGDLEKEVEAELVEDYGSTLKADILKAGHHGSNSSSTTEFLDQVKPEIVIIQSGENNSYGHPNSESLANMQKAGVRKILRNDLEGRIEFIF